MITLNIYKIKYGKYTTKQYLQNTQTLIQYLL